MKRWALFITGGLALTALLVPVAVRLPIRLVWNASASAPIGLYAVRPIRRPVHGELLLLRPPAPLARFATERRYLPVGVPLIKPVAAIAGDTVCRTGRTITVNRHPVGQALDRDGRGRSLPAWQGCRALGQGELFVMNAAVRDSFDGRYFGPLPISTVLGRARPVWIQPSAAHPQKEPRP